MNDLSVEVKAKEIHENAQFWHNRAEHNLYRFFLEVKEIRDNRYYKELGYSSFEDYSLDAWNIGRQTMDERIKIANTFSEDDFASYSLNFGHKKTLLLTSMEEPQREKTLTEGVPTEQGYKSYDKATQKEIADYKRNAEEMELKAKEYEHQLKQQEQQNETLQQQLEQVENKEPKTVVKEVVPAHVKAQLSDKENELIENRRRTALLEKELNDMKSRSERKTDKSQEKLSYDDEIGSRRFKAESSVLDLRDEINEFLEKNAINAFREGAIATSSQRTKDSLMEGIEELELFCKSMRNSLDSNLIIN